MRMAPGWAEILRWGKDSGLFLTDILQSDCYLQFANYLIMTQFCTFFLSRLAPILPYTRILVIVHLVSLNNVLGTFSSL